MHYREGRWIFREWAPNATAIYLKGVFSDWRALESYALDNTSRNGTWEIVLPEEALHHGDEFRFEVHWPDGSGDRIPAWTRRAIQNQATFSFNAQIWHPETRYQWRYPAPEPKGSPFLVYETHVGMATAEEKIGTFDEFRTQVLPRIRDAGYDAVQIMALAEHPYYASFGYQVSIFFCLFFPFRNSRRPEGAGR